MCGLRVVTSRQSGTQFLEEFNLVAAVFRLGRGSGLACRLGEQSLRGLFVGDQRCGADCPDTGADGVELVFSTRD